MNDLESSTDNNKSKQIKSSDKETNSDIQPGVDNPVSGYTDSCEFGKRNAVRAIETAGTSGGNRSQEGGGVEPTVIVPIPDNAPGGVETWANDTYDVTKRDDVKEDVASRLPWMPAIEPTDLTVSAVLILRRCV